MIELLNTPNARKIFGKKEIEIILKQIENITLTQSEKNRLSRDIRPKFEFIKEMNNFQEDFDLKKNQDNKKLIKKAVSEILNNKFKDNIDAILLFGSHANNTSTFRSDIDICIVFKSEISLKEATEIRIKILGNLSKKIDLQIFNLLPFNIKSEISKNHRILYKSKEFDNTLFSIKYIKDEDYIIRMKQIFGVKT